MHQSAEDAFIAFSEPLEGRVRSQWAGTIMHIAVETRDHNTSRHAVTHNLQLNVDRADSTAPAELAQWFRSVRWTRPVVLAGPIRLISLVNLGARGSTVLLCGIGQGMATKFSIVRRNMNDITLCRSFVFARF